MAEVEKTLKYHNVRYGKYASKREANRAAELRFLEKIGEISDLREQVSFELLPKQNGERAVHYVSDFVYRDKQGILCVEDTKGFRTREYILKRKLLLFRHGIKIREV